MPKGLKYCIGIVAGVGLLVALAWPYIQRELMREPIMDAVDAVRAGDAQALRDCFTGNAQVSYVLAPDAPAQTLSVENTISLLEPHMHSGELHGMASVGDLDNITRMTDDVVSADVAVTFYVDGGEDIPYRNIPYTRAGHVELKRMGWLTYKIQHVSTGANDFRRRLQ